MLAKDMKTCFVCLLQYQNNYFSNKKTDGMFTHTEIFISNSRQAESKNTTKVFLKFKTLKCSPLFRKNFIPLF